MARPPWRRKLARWCKRRRTAISLVSFLTVLLVVVPATAVIFPDNSAWLAALVVGLYAVDEFKDLVDQLEDEADGTQ